MASRRMVSAPTIDSTTFRGAFPGRKPLIFSSWARRRAALALPVSKAALSSTTVIVRSNGLLFACFGHLYHLPDA